MQVEAFFDVHEELGSVPGGIHLEMTGDDVTECLGGGASVDEADLDSRYHTHCDPRLNAEQALEMAFYVASRLAKSEHLHPSLLLNPYVALNRENGLFAQRLMNRLLNFFSYMGP